MSNKIRYMYIDILKTVAIFAIIISHVCIIGRQAAILNIPFAHFQHIGKVGVPLFLMISGALLLNRDYPSIKEFIYKKTLRIVPPYFFWMLIALIVIGILNALKYLHSQPEPIIYNGISDNSKENIKQVKTM